MVCPSIEYLRGEKEIIPDRERHGPMSEVEEWIKKFLMKEQKK